MGRITFPRQCWTHGQKDRIRHRTYWTLRQWCTIRPRRCEVRVRENLAKVEASSSQYRCALVHMVRMRGEHEHRQLPDCIRSTDLQLPPLVGGQYRFRSIGTGLAWMALDL